MVSSPTSAQVYTGNGSSVDAYPVNFPFLLASDVFVAVTTGAGVTSVLTPGADYTLTPLADADGGFSGGSIVTATAYDSTHQVTIFRQVPITQLTELPEAGPFPASAIERAYDKLTMVVQQLHRRIMALEGSTDSGAIVVVPESPGGAAVAISGMQIFADASARAGATPGFAGQFAVQLSDRSLWTGVIPTIGSWTPAIFSNATKRIMARKTAGSGAMEECTTSDILDFLTGATDGDIPYRSSGAWTRKSAGADVQEFATPGSFTWTKPTHAKWVEGWIVAGGGGGASGRRGATSTARFGGTGGAAGGFLFFSVPAAALGSTASVTVGAGGAGGASITVDSTNGASGTRGENSSIQGITTVVGGAGGLGGSTTVLAGPGGSECGYGVSGATSNITCPGLESGSTSNNYAWPSSGGGGGGGPISSTNVASAGTNGVAVSMGSVSIPLMMGTRGAGGNGIAGGNAIPGTFPLGCGGGGGGANATAAATAGGAGTRGGGGGGGSASLNTIPSGAGGKGGDGYVIIISY